jgi:hypothetical protein
MVETIEDFSAWEQQLAGETDAHLRANKMGFIDGSAAGRKDRVVPFAAERMLGLGPVDPNEVMGQLACVVEFVSQVDDY